MMRHVREWWHARQRAGDEDILFPVILEASPTMRDAMKALAVHVSCSPCWKGREDEAFERFRVVCEMKAVRP